MAIKNVAEKQLVKFMMYFRSLFALLLLSVSMPLLSQETLGTTKWFLPVSGGVITQPAIDDDTIVFGGADGYLYKVNSEGEILWKADVSSHFSGPILSSPAIDAKGNIYIGSQASAFFAFDSEGNKKWEFQTDSGIWAAPAIAQDGTVYFNDQNTMHAISPGGTLLWSLVIEHTEFNSPVIDTEGYIHIATPDWISSRYYRISPDGQIVKNLYADAGMSQIAIRKDGTAFFVIYSNVYSLAGNILETAGSVTLRGSIGSSLLIDGSKRIYVVADDAAGVIGESAQNIWNITNGYDGYIEEAGSGVLKEDGTLFVGQHAYDSEGNIIWSLNISDYSNSLYYATVGGNGTLYGAHQEGLYAIHAGSSPLAKSDWPTLRGNLRNTGNISPLFTDQDEDGVFDHQDNCINLQNADQLNNDLDSLGDVCDADDDNDKMPDDYEILNGLDPYNTSDAETDLDADGLSNIREFELGTNPIKSDSDGDGIGDGDEVSNGTNPLVSECLGFMCGSLYRGWRISTLKNL